ncbi:MAG TPA: phospholipase D-like domain-containing protein [Gammaproteobacteria bacterium]|nr:phospholipase D-like domain-containing protein [Gammaproteobacteria bacterium]
MELIWNSAVFVLVTLLSVVASAHAILTKRDPRAAVSWVALLWLVPFFGALLYLLLGINRIHRRASRLGRPAVAYQEPVLPISQHALQEMLGPGREHFGELAEAVDRVSDHRLVGGNEVLPLANGEQAYPEMLRAIGQAQRSVTLSTYIFGSDAVGRQFMQALRAAVGRGVEVRVLIDNAGERYSWPSAVNTLRRMGVPVSRFYPGLLPRQVLGLNLRNHRKLLVVDGRVGFTGGMNLRVHHLAESGRRRATRDLHFRIEGPVVRQLQDVFVEDWTFCTGEYLEGPAFFPVLEPRGNVMARGVPGGPDESLGRLHWTLHAAIHAAHRSIRVVTPYFLPDTTLVSALNLAVLRGVAVDIVLPGHNNLPYVQWAMMAHLWQVMELGCRVWLTPGPFDHTKLMLVDDVWTFIGSMNWDPRSLRLNFEFNCECYGPELVYSLESFVQGRRREAREITMRDLDRRNIVRKLRDGLARLLMPYL